MDKALALDLATMIQVAYDEYSNSPLTKLPRDSIVIEATLKLLEDGRPVSFGFVASESIGTEKTVYVAIRGTIDMLEWFDDAYILPCAPGGVTGFGLTTDGFEKLYRQLSPLIISTLQRVKPSKVYITGHSLGAALAHLAAVDILYSVGIKAVSYTFCGPRCGNPAFATAYNKAGLITWRIFNTEDIVPTLPLATTDATTTLKSPTDWLLSLFHSRPSLYEHVGSPFAITANTGSLAGNHSLTTQVDALNALS